MKKLFTLIICLFTAILIAAERSPEWEKLRNSHVKKEGVCQICGSHSDLQVHHIKPFKLWPEKELDPENLITVCRSKRMGFDCHLAVAHGGNFRYYNPYILEDIATIRDILKAHGILNPEQMEGKYTMECQSEIEQHLKVIKKETKAFNICVDKKMKEGISPDEACESCKR